MDDTEDDARYPPKPYSLSRSKKFPLYSNSGTAHYNHDYVDDDFYEENDGGFDDKDIENEYNPRGYANGFEQIGGFGRYPKRQKVRNAVSNCEFVPRSGRLGLYEDGNFVPEWSENEKFVLLEVWGDRFLQLGRNSLRSDDWVEVAEKVSAASKIERTEAQCRQMMDGLKRKYKKEKAKEVNGGKWAYFKKMDMLMKPEFRSGDGFGLGCGLDSGEYVFMDTNVYLDCANGNDEMRDSPCESEEEEEAGEGPKYGNEGMKGLRVLADSVQKFGEIYEKIENSKREQIMELERMRVEFQTELELQKKQILERAQSEIAKIREEGSDEETDTDDGVDDDDDSGPNVSESMF